MNRTSSFHSSVPFLYIFYKRAKRAARQGFEPRYSPPKGDVLPLDLPAQAGDPARFSIIAGGPGLEPGYSPPKGDVLPLDDPPAIIKNSQFF